MNLHVSTLWGHARKAPLLMSHEASRQKPTIQQISTTSIPNTTETQYTSAINRIDVFDTHPKADNTTAINLHCPIPPRDNTPWRAYRRKLERQSTAAELMVLGGAKANTTQRTCKYSVDVPRSPCRANSIIAGETCHPNLEHTRRTQKHSCNVRVRVPRSQRRPSQ